VDIGAESQVGRSQSAPDRQTVLLPQLPAGPAVERPVARRAVVIGPALVMDIERYRVGLLVIVVNLPGL
jgi:hypothetical protein